jgi:hypothetical protein
VALWAGEGKQPVRFLAQKIPQIAANATLWGSQIIEKAQ